MPPNSVSDYLRRAGTNLRDTEKSIGDVGEPGIQNWIQIALKIVLLGQESWIIREEKKVVILSRKVSLEQWRTIPDLIEDDVFEPIVSKKLVRVNKKRAAIGIWLDQKWA